MRSDEMTTIQVTPAQARLLSFFSHLDCSDRYAALNVIFQTSISAFSIIDDRPTQITLNALHTFMEMRGRVVLFI